MFTDLGLYLVGSLMIFDQFTNGVQGTAGSGRGSIAGGNSERLISGEVNFRIRSSNCLGIDLEGMTELCRLSLQ